jgi:hypothetical protein
MLLCRYKYLDTCRATTLCWRLIILKTCCSVSPVVARAPHCDRIFIIGLSQTNCSWRSKLRHVWIFKGSSLNATITSFLRFLLYCFILLDQAWHWNRCWPRSWVRCGISRSTQSYLFTIVLPHLCANRPVYILLLFYIGFTFFYMKF